MSDPANAGTLTSAGWAKEMPIPNAWARAWTNAVNSGATDCRIYRVAATSTIPSLIVSGIQNLTGVAADSSYVYWTQNDGRVYRHYKF